MTLKATRIPVGSAATTARYSVGDLVTVRVTELADREKVVARYQTKVTSADGATCRTAEGSVWDSLTGNAVGWLSHGQHARIALARYSKEIQEAN